MKPWQHGFAIRATRGDHTPLAFHLLALRSPSLVLLVSSLFLLPLFHCESVYISFVWFRFVLFFNPGGSIHSAMPLGKTCIPG